MAAAQSSAPSTKIRVGTGRKQMWLEELPPPPMPLVFYPPEHVSAKDIKVWAQLDYKEPFTSLVPFLPLTDEAFKELNFSETGFMRSDGIWRIRNVKRRKPAEVGESSTANASGTAPAEKLLIVRKAEELPGKMWLMRSGFRRGYAVTVFEEDWVSCYPPDEPKGIYSLYEDRGITVETDVLPAFRKNLLLLHTKLQKGYIYEVNIPHLGYKPKRNPLITLKRFGVMLNPVTGLVHSTPGNFFIAIPMDALPILVPSLSIVPYDDPFVPYPRDQQPIRKRIMDLLELDPCYKKGDKLFEEMLTIMKVDIIYTGSELCGSFDDYETVFDSDDDCRYGNPQHFMSDTDDAREESPDAEEGERDDADVAEPQEPAGTDDDENAGEAADAGADNQPDVDTGEEADVEPDDTDEDA